MTEITAITDWGIKCPNVEKNNVNGVRRRVREAKAERTNFAEIPNWMYDRRTAAWIRSKGYKAERHPLRKIVLVSWEYKESARRSGR